MWESILQALGMGAGSQSAADAAVNPNSGHEQERLGSYMKGGSQLLEGIWGEDQARKQRNRDLQFRNADMQQAYQNNLPAMLKARQGSRQTASTLAALSGLY